MSDRRFFGSVTAKFSLATPAKDCLWGFKAYFTSTPTTIIFGKVFHCDSPGILGKYRNTSASERSFGMSDSLVNNNSLGILPNSRNSRDCFHQQSQPRRRSTPLQRQLSGARSY